MTPASEKSAGIFMSESSSDPPSESPPEAHHHDVEATRTRDADVVRRVLAGDVEAFQELVERYQYGLFSCAFQLLRSREDAEEAAQEAFVQAFQKLEKLREPAYFFSWAWRITTTVALKLRQKKNRLKLSAEADSFPQSAAPEPIEREERNQQIAQALGKLPEEQRMAITLRFWQGMDYDSMAELFGLSHDALYQRVSRGLKRLREILGEDFAAPLVEDL